MNKYKGAIHIHSLYSDGTGDINSISKAAKKAGLKWIIITDHNNMDVEEGIINGVCVIRGEEISPEKENHYLALGITETIKSDNPDFYIQKTKELGGFGFIAHPDEGKNRKNNFIPIKWNSDYEEADGVEIWNWFSQWADNYDNRNIFTIIYSYFFAHKKIKTPYNETMEKWDRLNNNTRKIIPAIAGVDAHALKINKYIIPVTIFPYKKMFSTLANVIYTKEKLQGSFEHQKKLILNALKIGNNVILNRSVYDKIPFIGIANKKTSVTSGEKIELDNSTYLKIRLQKKAQIKIYCDGSLINMLKAKDCEIKINKSGKYRTELLIKEKGWIYTNPIEVYEVKSFERNN